jgi:PAS domain S-box-containing protein
MNVAAWFRDVPIKRKLLLIGLLTSGIALLSVSLILTVRGALEWQEHSLSDMRTYVRVIGSNIAPAMMFDDRNAANETLAALAANPDIVDAVIYDNKGEVFARYSVPHHPPGGMPFIKPGAFLFTLDQLVVTEPVQFKGSTLGTIYLESDLHSLYKGLLEDTVLTFLVAAGVFLAAVLLFVRLQKAIVAPILDLAAAMQTVSARQNYGVRVAVHGKDEVGMLAHTFNTMLERIQSRDAELAQYREHLEDEVVQRTAKLTEAQRIAHLGNWEWYIVGDILTWSDEIYRIFGLTPQQFEATYDAFLQAVHPEDRQLVESKVREALEQQHPYSQDHRILLPDGTVRHVHEQAEVIRGESGQALKMVGTVQDITERKEAARSLEESERKLRAILDAAVDGILVADADANKFVLGNRAICDMLGYRQDEIGQLGVSDIHPPEVLEEVQRQFAKQLRGEIRVALNLPVKRKDGSLFFADISSSPMELAGHHYLVGIFHDVTERMQAEERIRESEARYRGIFEYADDIIYLLEPDGTFRSLSPAFERITGWRAEEWIGKPFAPIVHPDDLPYANEVFRKTLAGESASSFRLRLARKSGVYFDADLSITPLGREVVRGALGIARDVTERKQMEEKIQKLNEELEIKVQERTRQLLEAQEELVRKEKLAVLGQVAGSVGHELRNPLGVMSNAVYFLQAVLTDADQRVKDYLGIIENEIAGSERIVSDLLDSVRTKPPRPEAVGARVLIEQTLGKLTIPSSVAVKLDFPESLPALWVDAMQIHQVFRNLISNGVEAMPDGGTLEIRAVENRQDGTVAVSVHDSGAGIAPELLPKLFLPLYTTKSRGIGLGLVVVQNLTKANGGSVEVQSEPGKGATFTVTFPCEGAAREPASGWHTGV